MLNAINPVAKPIAAAISIFSCGDARPKRSYKYSDVIGHVVISVGVQFIWRDRKTALCKSVDA